MKKKYIFSIPFIILFVFIGFKVKDFVGSINLYSNVIYSNWDVQLPENYKELYSIDDSGFNGDGSRYHIFEYTDSSQLLNSLDWNKGKSSYVEGCVLNIIESLDISTSYVPNFKYDYMYYTQKKNDSSYLYIIFIENSNMVYIAESFM